MKTNLEQFCENVAHRALDTTPDKVDMNNLGFDISILIQILAPIVIQLLEDCINKNQLKKSVKSPTWFQKAIFRARVNRAIDISGHPEFRPLSGKLADSFFAESAVLTEEEVNKVVTEVTVVDNWIL